MPDSALSAPQLQVVDALFNGANLNAAADQAGVHRNTIAYWRHTEPAFEAALRDAQNERADMLHEEAIARASLAFQVLEQILQDPKSSTSARLRAAIFILTHALPCPAKPRRAAPALPKSAPEPVAAQESTTENPISCTKMHKFPRSPIAAPAPKPAATTVAPAAAARNSNNVASINPKPPPPDKTQRGKTKQQGD